MAKTTTNTNDVLETTTTNTNDVLAKAEAKREKSAKRRAQRKENDIKAIAEIASHLNCDVKELSEEAQALIKRCQHLGVAPQKIDVKEGDTLQELFVKFPNLSYKKLEKKCGKLGLVIGLDGKIKKA